jgi:DNA-binding response OmpR family regulator
MKQTSRLDPAVASRFAYVSAANVTIDRASQRLHIDGKPVHCTRTHLRLLTILVVSFCVTVPYERLMDLNGQTLCARQHNLLKVQMCHLRRLLEEHACAFEIRNIYGMGYQARPARRSSAEMHVRISRKPKLVPSARPVSKASVES